jgi:hypothetical protein
MSHHGNEPFDGEPEDGKKKFEAIQKRNELMRDLLSTTGFRGALGEFPEGQLSKTDEGSIQFAIGQKDGKVVLDFGTPVHWVGMNPQQAADLASSLMKKAREVARANGEMVSFTIG